MKREEVFEFFRRLAEANPSPTTELESGNPYQLLVAVVLSAQATDASVNIATRRLFERIKNPRQMMDFGEESLRNAIKPSPTGGRAGLRSIMPADRSLAGAPPCPTAWFRRLTPSLSWRRPI